MIGFFPLALILFGAIIANALCGLGALAISRSSAGKLRQLRHEESYSSTRFALARFILARADKHHLGLQAAAFFSVVVGVYTSFLLIQHFVHSVLHSAASSSVVGWSSTIVMVLFVCTVGLFALQLAKTAALADPDRMLLRFATPIVFVNRLFSPLTRVLLWAVERTVKIVAPRFEVRGELTVSAEELSSLVDKSTNADGLEDEQRELIQSVFSLTDTRVQEIMTPRSEIISVAEEATLAEVAAVFEREGFSRILVHGEHLDEVRGVILMKDLIPFIGKDSALFSIARVLRPAYFIPKAKRVDELLDEFRKASVHFGVVLDEHGAVDGVVTFEDVLEEIVGEISDEYDTPGEITQIRKTRSGDLIVSGSVRIEEINERVHLGIPEGEYETIAGCVLQKLGRIPQVGEVIEVEGVRIRVEAVVQKRITLLRLIKPRKASRTLAISSDTPTLAAEAQPIEPLTVEPVSNRESISTVRVSGLR